jgi:magnesium transporter
VTRLLVYHATQGFQGDVAAADIGGLLADPAILLWLDLEAPTAEEQAQLLGPFAFHPLALEDVEHAHQRPKIEQYQHGYFMILYAIGIEPDGGAIRADEIALFVGERYLVTVHAAPVPALAEVAARWRVGQPDPAAGISTLLHSLLDTLVDDYFPVVDELGDRIDDLEDRVFSQDDGEALQPLFQLKKDLLVVRRIVAPERDVVNVLLRRELPFLQGEHLLYYQDVYDHLSRLTESVDTLRDLLSSAMEAYLSVVSNRLNQVMKTLTAISAMLMSVALVAGIYGMNFRYMPELQWQYGYPLTLGVMLALFVGLGLYFRRKGWL